MTLVGRAFDLLLKHQWDSGHRCPECRGWDSQFCADEGRANRAPYAVGDYIGHQPDCEWSRVVREVVGSRTSGEQPVLRKSVLDSLERPSDRGCQHSAQSWYIKGGAMGCHDCDGN